MAKKFDVRLWNILVNAVAVMLVYSSYYGGAAVMPTAFADMMGRNGIDGHTAFTGLMINNMFVVLAAIFTPFLIELLGLRLCLVLGSLATIPINLALLLPFNFTIFIGQAINGIGNALSRAVSLQFLAANSTKENMARNSGLHWMIFMSCILFGNLVMLLGIGDKLTLDDNTRMVIAGTLASMCALGSVLYCFTKPIPSDEITEETPLNKDFTSDKSSASSLSLSSEEGATADTKTSTMWAKFRASLEPLLQKKNLYLLLPLCTTGIYSQLYTPLIPAYIGILFDQRSFIAEFGIFVGIGEILGGRLAGRFVDAVGFKRAACIVTACGTVIYALIAAMFPLFLDLDPVIYPNHWADNTLGVFIGVIDVSNNVILTTAIGTVFKESSTQIFVLVVMMMNISGVVRYIMMSYFPLVAIVTVNVVGLWGSALSLCLIKTK